jgi:hypothetical protein
MQISGEAIYWFRDGNEVVVVHIPTRQRLILNGVSDFIWRQLAHNASRESTAVALMERYEIAFATACADLDDFVEELVAAHVLIRTEKT